MGSKTEKTVREYEEIAEEYTEEHVDDMEDIADILGYFIDHLEGDKVLDVGCGPGRDARYFVEKGLDVTGIDLTSKFTEIASERVPKAEFLKMDMRDLEFSKNTFDGIWVCASFFHVPKDEARETLKEFKGVLKPDGIISLSVKGGEGEKYLKTNKYGGEKRFFAFYKEEEIKEMARSCGFKIKKVKTDKSNSTTWINLFLTPSG